MSRILVGFEDAESLARFAASEFSRLAKKAIWDRGVFRVALAGGSTPRKTYELLAEPEFSRKIEWNSVQIFFGDERAVEPDHPDSNFNSANEALLASLQLHPSQIHRMAGEKGDLDVAAREYTAQLQRSFALKQGEGFPSFDLVMLGVGKDGHTASLFPFTEALDQKTAWVVRNDVPQLSTERLTLTAPVLNAAKRVLFLVAGDDKAEALERVLEGPQNPVEFPAQMIDPSEGEAWWLIDEGAAARLNSKLWSPSDLESTPA